MKSRLVSIACSYKNSLRHAGGSLARYSGAMSRPCIPAGGAMFAAARIVGARSAFSVRASLVAPRRAAGMRGSHTISGTRIDSSYGYHLSARPCSPWK